MIDWEITKIKFNRKDLSGRRPRIAVICDKCQSKSSILIYNKSKIIDNQLYWECTKCVRNRKTTKEKLNNQQTKQKISKSIKQKWANQEYQNKITPKTKQKISKTMKQKWKDQEYAQKISKSTKKLWQDKNYQQKILNSHDQKYLQQQSKRSKEKWKDKEYKQKISESTKQQWENNREQLILSIKERCIQKDYLDKMKQKYWQNDEYQSKLKKLYWENEEWINKFKSILNSEEHKQKMNEKCYKNSEWLEKIAEIRSKQPRISSIQKQLYSILDDLDVKYFKEGIDTKIGPYVFDCVIPLKDKKLLIECQGDYWHNMENIKTKDKQKSSYILNNFPDHEIKYLWEHEFKCKDKIIELLKYWTGITKLEILKFDFKNIVIKDCPAEDYKLLLSKYHYLPNAGRGGIAYGAYFDDKLIAVCIFSPLVRQNIPFDHKTTRELSRLCIHPKYQKKNFGSWFVSKCLDKLNQKYSMIISYCDTTFNHNGAIYKACNFKLDGKIKPDYWYVSDDGWVMHKKTLYNHARKMKMKESNFASLNGYKKIYGNEKLRFIKEL